MSGAECIKTPHFVAKNHKSGDHGLAESHGKRLTKVTSVGGTTLVITVVKLRRITEGLTIRQALASPLFGRTLHDSAAASSIRRAIALAVARTSGESP